MNKVEGCQELHALATEWRRFLHRNPELDYRLYKTAQFVTEKLASFGINNIETGVAETGIVALIQGQGGDGPTIGLRADMDALPIHEASNKPWESETPGLMHGCGHDGHTAMLLGAAKHLAATRNFRGSVALIFQPAEEDGRGAERMVREGIMDRYNINQVFGMHNAPDMEIGSFGICEGPILASLDEFDLVVKGKGGHAAKPNEAVDPVVIAGQIIVGTQTIVSRKLNPLDSLVISFTKLNAAQAYNIIPDHVEIGGTVRTFSSDLRDFAEQQMLQTARGLARAFGGDVDLDYRRLEPVTFNHTKETHLAIEAAAGVVGSASVNSKMRPRMGSEDFAYMLEARPGALIYIGNGATAALHNPAYDFNDEALQYGIGYWVSLVETVLAA